MDAVAYAPETRLAQGLNERVKDLIDRVDYRQALTDADKEAVYRLRYSGYLWEKAILPNYGRRLSDRFDDLDNTWIFGVFVQGKLVSSIRISVISASHPQSPASDTFADVLASEIGGDKVLIDPTRFVVDRDASRRCPDLRFATTRLAVMASEYFGADLLLASVRTEHQAFYHRTFGHRVLCDARPYATLVKPLSLMASDFPQQRDAIFARYPFFRSTFFERRVLFAPGLGADWQIAPQRAEEMAPALAAG